MNKNYVAALCLSTALLLTAPAAPAQSGVPQVSMVTLQVVQNPDGSQSVITPKGDLATLPGAGVNSRTAEIYMGAQGGFWYTDKKGQTVNLDATVQALQARRASNQQTTQVPQYAPEPYYQAPTQQQSTGSGASALGTAAAAGMGAMAGAAMSNSYYKTPYGTPMYYGANGHPYSFGNGEQRELKELNPNQKAVIYNKNQKDQQNKQQTLQQSQTNRQNQSAQSGAQQQNFQHQQQWYQNEMKQNPKQFQKAENNPFVSQDSRDLSSRGKRESSAERSSMRSKRGGGGRERGGGGGARGGGGRRR